MATSEQPPPYKMHSGAVDPLPGQPQQPQMAPPPPPPPQQQHGYQMPVVQQPMQHHNTTVVITGMGQQPVQNTMRTWSTGVCGCFEDPFVCLCVMCCQECYACYLANKAGETCCLPCCVPGWMISLRAHIRGKHKIMGSICDDCCMVACCYPCVMCQLSREIDNINKGMAPQ